MTTGLYNRADRYGFKQRPMTRLGLRDVPRIPNAIAPQHEGDFMVYDAVIDGRPMRWRVDKRGLRAFIEYYADFDNPKVSPVKALYERGRT